MSKILKRMCMFVLIAVVLASTGCTVSTDSNDGSKEESNIDKPRKKKVPVDNIKIEDLDWYIEEGIVSNDRYELFSCTNNSDYVIKSFSIYMSQKDDVTEKDIEVIHEYMKKELSCTDEDIEWLKSQEFGAQARTELLCNPGDSIENQHVYYYKGLVYVKETSHMELVEPDIATIEYVYNDKIYIEYYDFKTGKYSLDSEIRDAYQWPEYEIMSKIPKPDVLILEDDYSGDDYINLEAFDVSLDEFKEYINQCREYGFIEEIYDYGDYFSAEDVEGYGLRISYREDSNSMSVVLDAP